MTTPRASSDSSDFHTVCRVGDIPAGDARLFVVADVIVGVFNLEGSFFALANECPHAGASLAHGIVEGDIVSCRIHHWRFCIHNGRYLDEDNPPFDAKSFPVRVVGENVQVNVRG